VDPSFSLDFELFPETSKAWGLATLINSEVAPTGRSAGSLGWAGVFNTYFWVDFEKGVTGVFLAQTLPFGDRGILDLFSRFETSVYSALQFPGEH
jgi:methyl acetate hydrolase